MAGSMLGGRSWVEDRSAKVIEALAQSSINCVVQLELSPKLGPVQGRITLLDPIAIRLIRVQSTCFPIFLWGSCMP